MDEQERNTVIFDRPVDDPEPEKAKTVEITYIDADPEPDQEPAKALGLDYSYVAADDQPSHAAPAEPTHSKKDNKEKTMLSEEEIKLLKSMIESHMGQWNKDYDGNEILPKPKSKYQRFVHLCDLLSSKKFLDIKFDSENNIIS